jgi:polar amino acid transport system substrate-binding protein
MFQADRRRRFSVIVTIILLAFLVTACSNHRTFVLSSPAPVLDRIEQRGEIVVGTAGSMPPLNMTTREGEVIGLEIDLARYLADSLGVKLNLQVMPFKELLPALESGKIDVIVSGMTITTARNSKVAFVGPYLISGKGILTKTATLANIESPSEIDQPQFTITALEGSTSQAFVQAVLSNAQFIPADDYITAVQMVRDGRADIMLADHPICIVSVARYPGDDLFTIISPFTYEPIGIALPARDPLFVNLVENFLATLEGSGALDNLKERWFQKGDWWDRLP